MTMQQEINKLISDTAKRMLEELEANKNDNDANIKN